MRYFAEIPIGTVTPNSRQPRQTFDEEALDGAGRLNQIVGLLQPIVVRKLGPDAYELIMGERRLRASKLAGVDSIPAIVRDTGDDDMLRDALMENLHRQQLNALEEAAAYQQLLDDFGATHEELATRIGRSRPHITNTLRLLNLPPAVQRRVAAGVLSAGHARALLGLDSPERQDALATRIVAEGLSVRAVEELIALGEGGDTKQSARRKTVTQADEPSHHGARRRALGAVRDEGQRRPRPSQGEDRRGVRLTRGPGAHHRSHEPRPPGLVLGLGAF